MMNTLAFQTIIVTGEDAESFLQGQFTCDMTKVTNELSLGAYCDAKGRMLSNFWIDRTESGFCLIIPAEVAEITANTLKKYGAFSKVHIDIHQAALDGLQTNRLSYIEQGLAFIVAATSQLFTPQMINWEKHGGVSFEKGCYLGQEIVARTQHLGKLKRHLHQFSGNSMIQACAGDKIVNPKNEAIGVVCDCVIKDDQITGLAVIHDSALSDRLILNDCELILFDTQQRK